MLRIAFIFSIIYIVSAEFESKEIQSSKVVENDEQNNSPEKPPEICHTTECHQIANDIWQSMNQSVDPCENFYEYACGRFAVSNPIPKTELSWSTFQKLRRTVRIRILELLTEKINSIDIMPVKQAKKFYRSCLNYFAIGMRGLKHIKAFLAQIGGWPLIMEQEEWNSKKISWQDINKFYARLIYSSPFYQIKIKELPESFNVSSDESENPRKCIKFLPPSIPLKELSTYTGKIFNKLITDMYDDGSYANYTLRIARMLANSRSAEISEYQMIKEVYDMIALEKKLQKMTENFSSGDRLATIDQLQEIYNVTMKTPGKSEINWKKMISEHFAEANVQLDGNELFYIENLNHLEVLSDILENTDPRTVANYMHWHFVSSLLPYTTLFQQALRIRLFEDKEGIKTRSRWENCIRNLEMPHVIAHQYVKKYFNNTMKDGAEQVFLNMQKEMAKQILQADWLSDEIKNVELTKIYNMKINIGFSDWYNNSTALTDLYQGLVIGNQYMENIISIKRFNGKRHLQCLKRPPKTEVWSYPLFVNAFFIQRKNTIIVPAAALQPPLFSVLQPNTVNYGELGYIISHEMSHGFDNSGIEFDQSGKHYNWPEDVKQHFQEKTQCFIEQYNKVYANDTLEEHDSEKELGEKFLNENLSDSVGLDIVFSGLQEIEKEKESPRLPGFADWSNKKMFFLSFARLYCTSETPELAKMSRKNKDHSKPNYRVNSPLQNSEQFAKVFNCPKDSPMNPSLKCKLW